MSAKFCCLEVRLFTLEMYFSTDWLRLFLENSFALTRGTYISHFYKSSSLSNTKSLNLRAKSLYLTSK